MPSRSNAREEGYRFLLPGANIHATRSVVMGRNGMMATSQPLASVAGLRVLQEGGNAIDAAVTAAAVLAVVEPSMTGIGGDLFAIVYDAKTGTLSGLNASGRSAHAATPEEFARRREPQMPLTGVLAVTVPGYEKLQARQRPSRSQRAAHTAGSPERTGKFE